MMELKQFRHEDKMKLSKEFFLLEIPKETFIFFWTVILIICVSFILTFNVAYSLVVVVHSYGINLTSPFVMVIFMVTGSA